MEDNSKKINKNASTIISVSSKDFNTKVNYTLSINAYLGHLGITIFQRTEDAYSVIHRRPIQPFIAVTIIPKKLEKLLKMEPGNEDSFNLLDWNPEEKKFQIGFTMSFKRNQDNKPMIIISAKDKPTVKFMIQMPNKVDLPNVSEYNKNNGYIESLINDLKTGTQRAILTSLLPVSK